MEYVSVITDIIHYYERIYEKTLPFRNKPILNIKRYVNNMKKQKDNTDKGLQTSYKKEWYDFINRQDYRYFITLSFSTPTLPSKYNPPTRITPIELQITSLNFLLQLLNKKIYGRNYRQKDLYLKGFSFFELSILPKYYPHYHILIQNDEIFNDTSKPSFKHHLLNFLPKIKNRFDEEILSKYNVEIDNVFSSDIIHYCNKTLSFKNDTHIGILS